MKEQFVEFVVSKKKELIKVGSAVVGAVIGVTIVTLIANQSVEELTAEDIFVE